MTRRRVALQPAYVLTARAYRDSSLLLECFSRDLGRVGLVARGARDPKSRSRALLQAFQPLLLSWNESGELGTVSGVEAAAPAQVLGGEAVFCGWYLNELLLRLTQRHDPHVQLYAAYEATLAALGDVLEPALRYFEKRLLAELGYGLDLDQPLSAERRYRLVTETGLIEPTDGEGVPGPHLIALRDETLSSPAELRSARQILRTALAPHLGGRELESARQLREMRRAVASLPPAAQS
jgi:DNA repair protein RecO (recombination protein O)